jgi:hypothetical protein
MIQKEKNHSPRNKEKLNIYRHVSPWLVMLFLNMVCLTVAGPYGVGYPRGKKTAGGRPLCGRATPQTAVRPFGGWPARRAYKSRAWRARMKL